MFADQFLRYTLLSMTGNGFNLVEVGNLTAWRKGMKTLTNGLSLFLARN